MDDETETQINYAEENIHDIINIILRKRQSLNLDSGGLALECYAKMRIFHPHANYQPAVTVCNVKWRNVFDCIWA